MVDPAKVPQVTIGLGGRFSILLVAGLSVIGFSSLVPVLPQISQHFSEVPGAETIVRSMVTVLGAAMAAGAPAAGFLAGRFGEHRVLRWALLLFAVAGIAGTIIDNIWLLLASRITVGLALSAASVTALALISNYLPDNDRNKWLGFWTVVGNIASITVMPLAALLGTIGWRHVLLLHLASVAVLWLIIRLVPNVSGPGHQATTPQRSDHKFPIQILLLGFACGAVVTTLPAFLPFHFAELGHAQPANAAMAIMALTVGGTISSFGFGWIRKYAGPGELFVLGFLIICAALNMLAWGRSVEMALFGMLMVGTGSGLLSPNLFSMAADAQPEQRARRIGWARCGYFGAPLVCQAALEPVAISYGADGAFLTVAGFALGMSLLMAGRRFVLAGARQQT